MTWNLLITSKDAKNWVTLFCIGSQKQQTVVYEKQVRDVGEPLETWTPWWYHNPRHKTNRKRTLQHNKGINTGTINHPVWALWWKKLFTLYTIINNRIGFCTHVIIGWTQWSENPNIPKTPSKYVRSTLSYALLISSLSCTFCPDCCSSCNEQFHML